MSRSLWEQLVQELGPEHHLTKQAYTEYQESLRKSNLVNRLYDKDEYSRKL